MMFSVNLLRQLDILEPNLKNLLWMILEEIEQHREASVTKTEFGELKEIMRDITQAVRNLISAQARTEQRLETLALLFKCTYLFRCLTKLSEVLT